MSLLEIIERLCSVTKLQAEIIQKQTEALEQAKIAGSVAAELADKRAEVATELDLIYKEGY